MSKESLCCQRDWSTDSHFSPEQLASLNFEKVPHHVAIIMDGNRRWARKQSGMGVVDALGGHWAGARALTATVSAAQELAIKVLTVWAFSTENWGRKQIEIDLLMRIFEVYLRDNRERMIEEGVRFHVIGDLTPISAKLRNAIERTTEETSGGRALDFVIGFNYGGRDDIKRAVVRLAKDVQANELQLDEINERKIATYLDTARWPDPDLLIRTSAEQRVSNFLLWQIAYSELYTTHVLWPDFQPAHLLQAVLSYQKRQRRMGR